MPSFDISRITTLGQLRKAGYKPRSIKEELRENLIARLQSGKPVLEGIFGFEETVMPELQAAILSRHNILLLGLRGQAKTRIARSLTNLLDEYVPVVQGSELNDDPMQPLSRYAHDLIAQHGDDTLVSWLHRDDRYTEKLATPDVSVADLIGDLDPIKAAALKLPYSDERVIHFGLIPRSHRGLFVINELPDLQARIQVALFNILQERDIQIRGFKLRLPLDIQFVFTANPEDYTNRGSIVTPLKDRIESQILTHYPLTMEVALGITQQEARLVPEQRKRVEVPSLIAEMIEQIAFEARQSEFVDPKSGVSARLTISAYENVVSMAERRAILNKEPSVRARVTDVFGATAALTGKMELVYEGEQEGARKVSQMLISKAIRNRFAVLFPDPEKAKRSKQPNPYQAVIDWFNTGHNTDLLRDATEGDHSAALYAVKGLKEVVRAAHPGIKSEDEILYMELVLFGLAESSQLTRHGLATSHNFRDMLGSLLGNIRPGGDDDDEDFGGFTEEDTETRPRRRR
jgi:magnesium chelatase subunit I